MFATISIPAQANLIVSSFAFVGNGGIDFFLNCVATLTTTHNNAPSVKTNYRVTIVALRNSYSIATLPVSRRN
jgi:hypothetical protein